MSDMAGLASVSRESHVIAWNAMMQRGARRGGHRGRVDQLGG